jgi:hypothetical protein
MCAATRSLLLAGLVGVPVALVTGSDLAGWLAAAVAVLAAWRPTGLAPGRPRPVPVPVPVRTPGDQRGRHLR